MIKQISYFCNKCRKAICYRTRSSHLQKYVVVCIMESLCITSFCGLHSKDILECGSQKCRMFTKPQLGSAQYFRKKAVIAGKKQEGEDRNRTLKLKRAARASRTFNQVGIRIFEIKLKQWDLRVIIDHLSNLRSDLFDG